MSGEMKKCITIDDLKQLNKQQLSAFLDLQKTDKEDNYDIDRTYELLQELDTNKPLSKCYFVFTINDFCEETDVLKMIEILDNKCWALNIDVNHNYIVLNEDTQNGFDASNLCDALWEAVKYVLRGE
ncbi:MAG: hypothetical protein ACTSPI_10290 [Candidatus Heimdallarchaeaceae archaeon]